MVVRALVRLLLTGCSLVVILLGGASSWLAHNRLAAASPTTPPSFEDGSGHKLASQRIWILCYESESSTTVVRGLEILTNGSGVPTRPLPEDCPWIAALHRRFTSPESKPGNGPAYDIFSTSWPAGTRQLRPAEGVIPLNPANRLVLFRVVASLEWRPATGSSYPAEVISGLRSASAYLYDLTDGQAAIGSVSLYSGGASWNRADMRFLAANDYSPRAYIGGIVPASREITTATGRKPNFVPSEIYLGRYWDGGDAFDPDIGSWDNLNAYRTLAHEWGHYALFLYDEYQKTGADGRRVETYCTCATLDDGCDPPNDASAMSFQYTAGEFWHPSHDDPVIPASCVGVDQLTVYGENDWKVLWHWGDLQGFGEGFIDRGDLHPGPPVGLVDDLFGRVPVNHYFLPLAFSRTAAPPPSEELGIDLYLTEGDFSVDEFKAFTPEVYLLKPGVGGNRTAIVAQGTTHGSRDSFSRYLGSLTLFGASSNDLVRVWHDRYTTEEHDGGRYIYPGEAGDSLPLDDGEILELEPVPDGGWEPGLNLMPELGGARLGVLQVELKNTPAGAVPTVQLCTPAADVRCPPGSEWRKTMNYVGDNRWTAVFTPLGGGRFPNFGYIRITVPGLGEIIKSFQMAGGVGPAHMPGDTPLRDGAVMVDSPTPIQGHSQVITMPAFEPDALHASLPTDVLGILGRPVDLDILMTNVDPESPLPTPVVVTLFYSQEAFDRLGIAASQLVMLHYNRAAGLWTTLPNSGSGTQGKMNWLSTPLTSQDGIFAIGWTP